MAFERFAPLTGEANMEIRNQSKTGPVVPPLADLTATMSDQIDGLKQQLLDRLSRDPASFAQIEVEIHDRFRRLADQMTASLLAEATTATSGERAGPEEKGGPAVAIGRDAHPRHGG
jgi:hypothetical protein